MSPPTTPLAWTLKSKVLRTPEACFADLAGFPYAAHLTDLGGLHMVHIDEGPADAPVVVLLHGEWGWSFGFRKMIPVLLHAGLRVVAPDLIGFGRSDKPMLTVDHSVDNHMAWLNTWLDKHQLHGATLFAQGSGVWLGLRTLALKPDRFDKLVLANGVLSSGQEKTKPRGRWLRALCGLSPRFPMRAMLFMATQVAVDKQTVDGYSAPFPDRDHEAGPRAMMAHQPHSKQHPQANANAANWALLERLQKPLLTLYASRDPWTRGWDEVFQSQVPGARRQPHQRILQAGHLLQEDKGEELALALLGFVQRPQSTLAGFTGKT